jgi:hypothetical protein
MISCRVCGASDVPLTIVNKPDQSGHLVPVSGVCGQCSAPRPRIKMNARVFTSLRPGICAWCRYDILIGEKISRLGDGSHVHAECRGED